MASKVLSFDQTALFKSIEISSNNAHPDKKTISLGLTRINPLDSYLSNIVNWSLKGRTTTISVEDADRIALLISNQIHAPVAVIVGFKAGKLAAKMQTHPETGERHLSSYKEEDIYAPLALEFKNIERFRTVVQFLEKQKFISSNDRKMLDPIIKEIEGSIPSPVATPGQKNALNVAIRGCIDDIIGRCANANSRDALLGKDNTWLTIREPFNKEAIARAILFESCQRWAETVFFMEFKGLEKGYDAAIKIQDIYKRGLESIWFERIGESVPQLDVQRAILSELIEEALTEKFGAEELEGIPKGINPAFVKALRQRLFSDGYSLDPISIAYPGDDLRLLQIDSFGATIDAMEGWFGEEVGDIFVPEHDWTLHDGTAIEGEAARERFEQIRAEVEATLAQSPSVATSTSTSTNNS